MVTTTLVWFRQDLRLADNPALAAAVARGGAVVPVYIWAPEEEGDWPPGAASRWWLHQSLTGLARTLTDRRSRLVLRTGPSLGALLDLAHATGADAVYWNRRHEPAAIARDRIVETALRGRGLDVRHFNAALMYEPDMIRNRSGGPFQVFTPFWRACLTSAAQPAAPTRSPRGLPAPGRWPSGLALGDFRLEPSVDWAEGIRGAWRPGEDGARRRLARFLREGLRTYPVTRDRPDLDGVSRLSPHLHFGEIGPRQILHEIRRHLAGPAQPGDGSAAASFVRQLGWREFAHHLMVHFPHTPERPLRVEFERFPWRRDAQALRAWRRGETGYGIVDAGMMQLWRTGWMHNRVRMIVASFLVKDLLIPWRDGARWFWDTLVDADLANNTLGWQWAAGCGADAAPYFRVFNPAGQERKHDPEGAYVRRWAPDAPRAPIVDHRWARMRALAAWKAMRGDA